ncbi:398_t:CDS:10 [Funneliformis mosseae]|uniref:398_t:CDS:1 n=1 Tax=Funneliformis mosseae TaxID=27381 RepID=A0A9N9FHG8_FUNMO|nr:398_t:CDS:10 [Funneliformis mosseae]
MFSQSYFSQNTKIYGSIKSRKNAILLMFKKKRTEVPRDPGHPVETIRLKELRSRVEVLVGVSNFPGAQPTSFYSKHIQELQNEDYYVCEQSYRTRVLAYITCDSPGKPAVFLIIQIDCKNYYHLIPNLIFPVPGDESFSQFHYETLLDCELVYETESDGRITPKLLFFDLLVMDKTNYMNKPLNKRLGYLRDYIMSPYENMLRKRPDLAIIQPFNFDFKRHNKNNKPRFCLYKWMDVHKYFDNIYVTDEVWEQFWKHDFQQYEGRIVEAVYNPSIHPPWRFKRFRDDQPRANHHTLISSVPKIRE